eukprot:m.122894 g.122894  ORF g.122894 m.122894 type:complete len:53 (-) comp14435_c0_seq8:1760-1918(-)
MLYKTFSHQLPATCGNSCQALFWIIGDLCESGSSPIDEMVMLSSSFIPSATA